MTTLVVVESPSKAKKIQKMLGAGFVVQASGGHIRDLPVKAGENGYNAETLEPVYELTERGKESVKYLKSKLAACDSVLLATDPDREGEAIGWHVAEVLGVKKRQRVKFHEITNSAVMAAVQNPTPLDNNLVRAQEARRVVDRMIGWLVSGPLSRSTGEKTSAGRVQSPSLGLVVEREREIAGFVKKQSFGASVSFGGWSADWVVPGADGQKCENRGDAERAAAARSFSVREFVERDEFEAPPAPFDTAVMQQAASVALGFDPEKTMSLAQKLFQGLEEGHGFITYHRTDDTNLSDDAFAMIQAHGARHGLPVIASKRKFKTSADAQEAHEAIRPTDFDADISALSADEVALYNLIHRRAVASQMPDVVYNVRRAKLDSDGMTFSAVGRTLKSKGWRALGVAAEVEDEDKEQIAANAVPALAVGDNLAAVSGKVVESWSRAPGRYTKASLIKTLKALGIGRPATYAAAVDGIEKKGYVTQEKRYLVPTPVAGKIYDALTGKFSFIRVDYTRTLEADLDAITQGKKSYADVVRGVAGVLNQELASLGGGAVASVTPPAGDGGTPAPAATYTPRPARVMAVDADGKPVKCPKCKKQMVVRPGPKGNFHGCSDYPKCKGTAPIPAPAAPLVFLVPDTE
jgi:DNA topoisomerase-1